MRRRRPRDRPGPATGPRQHSPDWNERGRRSADLAGGRHFGGPRRRRGGPDGGCPGEGRDRAPGGAVAMAILVGRDTRLLVQGITGYQGAFHTGLMLQAGTRVVAGVTPGKGGTKVHDVPVFETVDEAVRETGANAGVIFVPARFARDAALESIASRLDPVAVITEGLPVRDATEVVAYAARQG